MIAAVAVVVALVGPGGEGDVSEREEVEGRDQDREQDQEQDQDDGVEGGDEVRTVVVTGTRTERFVDDAPVRTQVYGRTEIERSGAENLAEVLEETPGVQVSRGIGGVGISMQGLDPTYSVVLVDGQRTAGRVGGTIDLSRFPAEQIEQVEIVRGPSSVLYGADALAGTINVITRRPRKPHEAEVHAAYGSFDTLDLTGRVGLRREHYAGSITSGWHRTDGWDADPSDLTTTGPRSEQFNIATTHDFGGWGPFSLSVDGSYLRRDSAFVDAQGTGAVFDRKNRTETVHVALTPQFESEPSRFRVTASYDLFRDQFLQEQRGSDALDQSQETYDHVGQVTMQYDHRLGEHVVSAGVDTQVELLTTDRIDPSTVDRMRYAVYVQDEWTPTLSPKIVVLPGVRVDYDTFFGIYPTPRLAMMVQPGPRWTFRTSYGRGYRAPTFREMFLLFSNPSVGYRVVGNPDLRPETSWSASFSAEFRPWQWALLAANVFDNRLQDTIAFDTTEPDAEGGTTLFAYSNIGEATTRGVEAQAAVTIVHHLTLEGSYTFVHTRDHEQDRPLPGRPRHAGTAGLSYSRPAWGTSIRLRSAIFGERVFYADMDGDEVEEAQTSPAFATLDLRLGQSIFHYLQVFAGIENILDAGNATDNPLQPRTFYGGATLRY